MASPTCVEIKHEWDIVHARQQGRQLAKELGFGYVDQARITTAISELARNIYLYAGKGRVWIEAIELDGKVGLRIKAEDQGPGIEDISKAMEDGYTTSGGLGAGLPGVKRLMDEFDLLSTVGEGTVITAMKFLR
ncbi:anti-sigma regulatory factor [Pullulanibacillus sp. KACC 23026]|uniref:anti-sigma regulatory factor n=1 Tax=Pullulanibacillus sp. KACC 23026 TaxID=3028315 RepID=UPI0023AEBF97|nr:anti-sigma regulatory factor [Pullulanibacillus sp. KACC 23026]WEG12525.1 anti-sigma regulatory factor [Pullulanibacillus sp. KACC 23026]